jgi:hypothetical protein
MLIILYVAVATVFYSIMAKHAPLEEEPTTCQVIELFAAPIDQPASRAA